MHPSEPDSEPRDQEDPYGEGRLLHFLMETIPDRIYFKDLASRFVLGSRSFVRSFGLEEFSPLRGKTDFDCYGEDHARAAFADEQEIIRTGEPKLDLEEMETWPDGRVTWCSTSKLPFRDEEGRVLGTFGISRDVTRRKEAELHQGQMEVELRHAQKLQAIGSLAAGIAHEINTPNQFMSDNTSFLGETLPGILACLEAQRTFLQILQADGACPPQASRLLDQIQELDLDYLREEIPKAIQQTREGISRVASIVKAMKDFSRPGGKDKEPSDLNQAIENTLTVSWNEWKYVTEVELDLDPALPMVPCHSGEICQAILNLVINGARAVEEARRASPGLLRIATGLEGKEVRISISDNGEGIPEAIRDRIFEPFFTTRAVGQGSGQGLAIVHAVVVEQHGGRVRVDSELGKGTTFHLFLPLEG